MQGADILLVMAQLAVAVAGFAGLVMAFDRGSGEPLPPVQVFRLLLLVESAAWVLFSSLLPFVLYHMGIFQETVWRVGSGLLLVGVIFTWAITLRRRSRLPASDRRQLSKTNIVVLNAVFTATILALGLNSVGLLPGHVFGVFLAGLSSALGAAVAMFLRIISATKIGWLIEDAPILQEAAEE